MGDPTGNLAPPWSTPNQRTCAYPAEAADFGHQVRAAVSDDEPWAPVSFDRLADGTPYLYMSGRLAPASAEPPALARHQEERPAVTRGWSCQAGMVAM